MRANHFCRSGAEADRTKNGRPTEATCGGWVVVTTASAVSETAAARDAGEIVFPSESRPGAASSHQMPVPSRLWMAMGTTPAFSSNVTVIGSSSGPNSPAAARANAVPTFGCPANGNSVVGVKIRTLRVCPASAGSTNVLSEKLNSLAICCICSADRPLASGTTASWLPPKRVSVKTSQM